AGGDNDEPPMEWHCGGVCPGAAAGYPCLLPGQAQGGKAERGRVEVAARESGQPVPEADVFVHHVPQRDAGGKRIETNVKTDARGVARVPGIPAGTMIVQVSAKGYRNFSRWSEHSEETQAIQIRLERTPHWEDKPK